MGYVLTTRVLERVREMLSHAFGASGPRLTEAAAKSAAMALLIDLDKADGLDSERLREVVEWAREQAKSDRELDRGPVASVSDGHRLSRRLAECDRIVELCDGILLALAESRLPEGAVRVLGRERLTEAGGIEEPLHVVANRPCDASMPAANTPVIAGLPSADRVALGQILATLRGEPVTAKPHEGAAVDVLDELDTYLRKMAKALDVDRTTSAPALVDVARECVSADPAAYSLPDTHPLRCYRWGDFVRYLMRVEELGASSGHLVGDRLDGLRSVLARVTALDIDGLRGVLIWAVLDKDVEALLEFAAGDVDVDVHANAESARRGRFVVPAVERGAKP